MANAMKRPRSMDYRKDVIVERRRAKKNGRYPEGTQAVVLGPADVGRFYRVKVLKDGSIDCWYGPQLRPVGMATKLPTQPPNHTSVS